MITKLDLLSNEEFSEIISNSACSLDVLKLLEYSEKENIWAYPVIADRMTKLNLTFGKKLKQPCNLNATTPLNKVLNKDSNYNRTKLKERLIKEGIMEYKCACCGISEWNGNPLTLKLHHVNGINNDNTLTNLQLLCPNCFDQIKNSGIKGTGLVIKRKCDMLPLEDRQKIMQAVETVGIVEARKILPYRNSLINAVVKQHNYVIIMITPDNTEIEFTSADDASKYLFTTYNIGNNPLSNRHSITKCYLGKQNSIKGFKFIKRSTTE